MFDCALEFPPRLCNQQQPQSREQRHPVCTIHGLQGAALQYTRNTCMMACMWYYGMLIIKFALAVARLAVRSRMPSMQ